MTHKIKISNRSGHEDNLTVGANTQIFLDGNLLGGAKSVKFEVSAKEVAKVTIEPYAAVEIDANIVLTEHKVDNGGVVIDGHSIGIHTLSSFSPVIIDGTSCPECK